jgi:hypothetical protein
MAEDSRTGPKDLPKDSAEDLAADAAAASAPSGKSPAGAVVTTGSLEPGAPIPPDAIDPELVNLSTPLPRRHPLVAVAVLIVAVLLLYRMRTDLQYALLPNTPTELGAVVDAQKSGKLASAGGTFVRFDGLPDRKNAVVFDPKGGRGRTQVFRILGTGSKVLVATPVTISSEASNHFAGRLRRFEDLSFAEAVVNFYQQTQVLRALDLQKLQALPMGPLPQPLTIADRSGEPLTISKDQELLVDVLFDDDLRVLLSKEKFPSEPDARHEVERLGLPHGPGIETKDGYGYVLRLPPKGIVRQRVLAQIDALGIWLWHRVETFRVPLAAVSVTTAGLVMPGPDALSQPVRYRLQAPTRPVDAPTQAPETAPTAAVAPTGAAAPTAAGAAAAVTASTPPPAEPTGPALLESMKDPMTVLLWEQVQAVQISEPLQVPEGAWLLSDGEGPRSTLWTVPVTALLGLFLAFNVWYLLRSLKRPAGA